MTLLRGYTGEAEDAYAEALALFAGPRRGAAALPGPAEPRRASTGSAASSTRASSTRTRSCASPMPRATRACGSTATSSSARTPGSPGSSRTGLGLPRRGDRGRSRAAATGRDGFRLGLDVAGVVPDDVGVLPLAAGLPGSGGRAGRSRGRARHRARPSVLARLRAVPLRVPASLASRAGDRRGAGDRRAARRPRRATCRSGGRSGRACSARRRARSAGPTEGLRQIADGLDQYQDLRTPPVFWPFIRFIQAGAHVDAGTPGPGFPLIDEAIAAGRADEPDRAAVPHRPRRPVAARARARTSRRRRPRTSAPSRWRSDSAPGCRSSGRRRGWPDRDRRRIAPAGRYACAPSTRRSPRAARRRT